MLLLLSKFEVCLVQRRYSLVITNIFTAAREEEEDRARRRARREGHERRKRERIEHGRSRRHSESDTSEEYDEDRPQMLEAAPSKRSTHADDHVMSGGL
jgi:hypothetical protein